MGNRNIAVGKWLSAKERFADFMNAVLFQGEHVIKPQELQDMKGEADIILTDKSGKKRGIQRYRDIVKRWGKQAFFVILAIENQDKIHYAMPVRNMIYDGLSYAGQIEKIWEEHKLKGDKVTDEEFLSRFAKNDRLHPVITVVFYYGTKVWDASTDLYGMLYEDELDERIARFVPNYRINLVDVGRIENLKVFRGDLQLIFGMLKYRERKEELMRYVTEHADYFSKLDKDTFYAVSVLLSSEKQLIQFLPEKEKEEVDMCKALEDLYADGKEEGREEGIRALLEICKELGVTRKDMSERLEEKFSISTREAEQYLTDYWK